jgi:Rrf2 family protein
VTRETDYAVRTVLYLARERDRNANVTEIAQAMQIPKSFLAKILQRLVRHHILQSLRGVKGGFMLSKKPSEITLLAVMEAIQGPAGINVCAIDSRRCAEFHLRCPSGGWKSEEVKTAPAETIIGQMVNNIIYTKSGQMV